MAVRGSLGVASGGLLLAGFTEFLLLRLLLRLGPLYPDHPVAVQASKALFLVGTTALNLALLMGFITLGTIVAGALRKGRAPGSVLVALGAGVVGGTSLLGLVVPLVFPGIWSPSVLPALLGVTAGGMLLGLTGCRGRARFLLALLFSVYLLAFVHFVGRGGGWAWAVSALGVAEGLVLLVGPLALLLFRPGWRWRAFGVAVGVALVYGAFALRMPAIASALVIWDLGLTSFLPGPAYVLSLGVFTYTVASLYGRASSRPVATGLALVALGGLRVDYTYYLLLGLVGYYHLASSAVGLWRGGVAAEGTPCPAEGVPAPRHAGVRASVVS